MPGMNSNKEVITANEEYHVLIVPLPGHETYEGDITAPRLEGGDLLKFLLL